MNADDYFTTPPENHWSQLDDVWEEEDVDLMAEWQASTAEAWIWEKNY